MPDPSPQPVATDPVAGGGLAATHQHTLHTMQCMEVWGGTGESDNGVSMPGLDAWVLSRPYQGQAAGGDIHYLSSCGTGRISRVLVADVAGHGETVADLARGLRGLMRRYVNYVDQGRFVSTMNREFAALADSGRFATAVVATYFAPTRTLALCNAAHPRPLAFSSRRREWLLLDHAGFGTGAGRTTKDTGGDARGTPDAADEGRNLPLGIVDDERYEQFIVKMRTGDLVLVYSDSLIEARSPAGEFLQEGGLLRLARELSTDEPSTLARRLYDRVLEFTGGTHPDDDVTIMVLRPNGLATQASFFTRVLAPVRILGLALRKVVAPSTIVPVPELSVDNIVGSVLGPLGRRFGRGAREL